ncbi:hypothetical protein BJ742DRAFT_782968 [Cladochytrium replicatum]|nr:hypothetical protein BJ742DRAFT_782968 [Cladochytrium replicatum]
MSHEEQVNQTRKAIEASTNSYAAFIALHSLSAPEENQPTSVTCIGSAETNDIVLPAGPSNLGTFHFDGKAVRFILSSSHTLSAVNIHRGWPSASAQSGTHFPELFETGLALNGARHPSPDAVHISDTSIFLFLHQPKVDAFAIRVRDDALLATPPPHRYFDIDPRWKIPARFVAYKPPGRSYKVANTIGQISEDHFPGRLEFEVDGERYGLVVSSASKGGLANAINREEVGIDEADDGDGISYFVVFKDGTSGKKTYPGGRFVSVKSASGYRKGVVADLHLDFNVAYSPPCAFSIHATCPLPISDNWLSFPIEAGEKYHKKHEDA